MAKVDSSDPSFEKRSFDRSLSRYEIAVQRYQKNPQGYFERNFLESTERAVLQKIDPSFPGINKFSNARPSEFEQRDRERMAGYYKNALEKYKTNPNDYFAQESLKRVRSLIETRQNPDFYNQQKKSQQKKSPSKAGESNPQEIVNRRLANDPNSQKITGGVDSKSIISGVTTAVGNAGSAFENLGKKINSVSQITYSKSYEKLVTELDTFTSSITGSMDKFSLQIQKNLEPFSEYVGSTLGTLTGIVEDPLGPNGLGNVATRLLNKAFPGAGDKINNLNKQLNLEALARFPQQMMTGIDHILTGLRDLLSVPLAILSEIYNGLQAIMKSISNMISSIIDGFMKMLMDFLDSIIPIKSILGLLTAISDLAGQIGGLAGAFNLSMVTDITSQITGFTDQFTSVLNNPLDFAVSFLPANVSGFLSDLQNPQTLFEKMLPAQVSGFIDGIQNPNNLIKQFLPPQLAQGFDKIADMTGFGYHNNLGIGFKSVLEGTQKTVLQDITESFGDKMGVLGSLLAGQPDNVPETKNPKLKAGHNDAGYDETRREMSGAEKYTRTK